MRRGEIKDSSFSEKKKKKRDTEPGPLRSKTRKRGLQLHEGQKDHSKTRIVVVVMDDL